MLPLLIALFLLTQLPMLIYVDHTHKLALDNYTRASDLERRVNDQLDHTQKLVERVQHNG